MAFGEGLEWPQGIQSPTSWALQFDNISYRSFCCLEQEAAAAPAPDFLHSILLKTRPHWRGSREQRVWQLSLGAAGRAEVWRWRPAVRIFGSGPPVPLNPPHATNDHHAAFRNVTRVPGRMFTGAPLSWCSLVVTAWFVSKSMSVQVHFWKNSPAPFEVTRSQPQSASASAPSIPRKYRARRRKHRPSEHRR